LNLLEWALILSKTSSGLEPYSANFLAYALPALYNFLILLNSFSSASPLNFFAKFSLSSLSSSLPEIYIQEILSAPFIAVSKSAQDI